MELFEALILGSFWSWVLGISLITILFSMGIVSLGIKVFQSCGKIKNPEKWSAIIGGAGVSGLCYAKKLKDIGLENFVILEKNKQLGGTWYLNRYPGVACDVASHFYSFSFFLNSGWSMAFSGGSEIQNYLQKFATYFDLNKHIKYEREIDKVVWNEETRKWDVTTTDGEKYSANFFFHGTGALHVAHKPTFKGQEKFRGRIIHTAEWDDDLDLNGKRVAVIGTGASAVQLVPAVSKSVKELYLFQRTPAWVPKRKNFKIPNFIKQLFEFIPIFPMIYRYTMYCLAEVTFFGLFLMRSKLRPLLKKYLIWQMDSVLNNAPELRKDLIPKYEPGCKRITPSDTYLQALTQENIHLVTNSIESFSETGIVTQDNSVYLCDIIVLATGFSMQAATALYKCYGRGGKDRCKEWGNAPNAYLGIVSHGFPNLFMSLGPSTGLGHSSIIFMIECQVNYALDCLIKMSKSDSSIIEVKRDVEEKYVKWLKKNLDETVFHSGCNAYYQNKSGYAWSLWPRSSTEYWWSTLSCNKSDFIFS